MLTILQRVKSLCQAVTTKQLEFSLPTEATAGKRAYLFVEVFQFNTSLPVADFLPLLISKGKL